MRGIAAGGQTALRRRGVGIFCSVVWKSLYVVDPDLLPLLLVLLTRSRVLLLLPLLLCFSEMGRFVMLRLVSTDRPTPYTRLCLLRSSGWLVPMTGRTSTLYDSGVLPMRRCRSRPRV